MLGGDDAHRSLREALELSRERPIAAARRDLLLGLGCPEEGDDVDLPRFCTRTSSRRGHAPPTASRRVARPSAEHVQSL
jgi:hypothetical protein